VDTKADDNCKKDLILLDMQNFSNLINDLEKMYDSKELEKLVCTDTFAFLKSVLVRYKPQKFDRPRNSLDKNDPKIRRSSCSLIPEFEQGLLSNDRRFEGTF